MKPSEDLVGQLVSIQLGHPVYLFEYGAHAKWPGMFEGEQFMVQPMMKQAAGPGGPADPEQPPRVNVSDLLLGALVKAVGDDWIRVALFDVSPDQKTCNVMLKTIPSRLIVSIDQMEAFETDVPAMTTIQRAPAPPTGKILLGG